MVFCGLKELVGAYWLGQISTNSKCNEQAIVLRNEIKSKLKADELKEWDFKIKEHDDKMKLELEKHKDETASKNMLIKSMQAVGVAYGENQVKGQMYNVDDWF